MPRKPLTAEQRERANARSRASRRRNPMSAEQRARRAVYHRAYRASMSAEQKARKAARERAYRASMSTEQKMHRAERGRAYYASHPPSAERKARKITYARAWHERNKGSVRAYRQRNKERIAAQKRAWNERNKERVIAVSRAWRERHPVNPRVDYNQQKHSATRRGIEFLLSFRQWFEIWQASGHWEERGRGRGKYCMARFGDCGPYAVDNVKIITNAEND
jgi:hypothetical protein